MTRSLREVLTPCPPLRIRGEGERRDRLRFPSPEGRGDQRGEDKSARHARERRICFHGREGDGSNPRFRSAPCNTGSTSARSRSFAYPTHATSATTSNGASIGPPPGSRSTTPASSARSAVQRS